MKQNNTLVMVLVVGLVIVSALFAFNSGMPDTLTIAENEQSETITVTESVEIDSMPDEAEIYIEIETLEESAQDTKNENARITDSVMEALDAYGIEEDMIETTSYYLYEQKKWDRDNDEYIITGYTLRHVLKITTDDITQAGEIVDVAVDAEATGVNDINFGLSDETERDLKADALAQAAVKAEEKAQAIVDAVGVDLGDFVSISESSYYSRYYAASYAYDISESADESYETTISPEEVTVSGTVTLTYRIEQ